MANTNGTETAQETAGETSDQVTTEEQNTETTETTEETSGENTSTSDPAEIRLPDDHPLVKTLAAQKEELKALKASSNDQRVQELETEVSNLKTKAGSAETIQARYDRLEAFLSAVGGPLSKALDSRSFTEKLFETDEDIDKLVADWHKSNPSATSAALQSGGGSQKGTGPGMNDLLRAAAR